MSAHPEAESIQVAATTRRHGPAPFRVVGWALTAILCLLVLYPVGLVIAELFEPENGSPRLVAVLRQAVSAEALEAVLNTFIAVGFAGTGAMIIGCAMAFINERTDARLGWAADILPVLPMLVPSIAGAIGWVFLATPVSGFLNSWIRTIALQVGIDFHGEGPLSIYSWYGLIFVYMLYLTPFVYLPVSAALRNVDAHAEEAARISGAGPWETMRRITIPSVRPALGAAVLYVTGMGFAMFSVPIIIGTAANISIVPVEIVKSMVVPFPPNITRALGLSLWVVVTVGLAWWLQRRLATRGGHATIGGGKFGGTGQVHLGPWKWVARGMMVSYILATTILPLFALVIVSLQPFWTAPIRWDKLNFDNYTAIFTDYSQLSDGLRNSVLMAAAGATVAVALTAIAAYLAHARRTVPGDVVDSVLKLPSVVPHVVIAVAMVLAFSGAPFYLAGTFLILVLAYVILYLPQAFVQATSAFVQVGSPLREAASVSGAGPGRVFVSVLLPLMAPGLAAGWALLFVLMSADVTASTMLAGPHTPVVGFVIVNEWETGTFAGIATLAVIITLVSSGVVLTVLRFARSRMFVRGTSAF